MARSAHTSSGNLCEDQTCRVRRLGNAPLESNETSFLKLGLFVYKPKMSTLSNCPVSMVSHKLSISLSPQSTSQPGLNHVAVESRVVKADSYSLHTESKSAA